MAPILFDFSAYSGIVRRTVIKKLAYALGAEVDEIVGYQAAEVPSQYYMGRVGDISVCLPFDSEVIQSSRCTLMVKRLFGDVGLRLLIKLISRWIDFKLENMNCKAAAWP